MRPLIDIDKSTVLLAAALLLTPALPLSAVPVGAQSEDSAEATAVTPDTSSEDVTTPPADAERTPSGLITKVLQEGTGDYHPDGDDMVAVHYTIWKPSGEKFRSTYDAGQPAIQSLDKVFAGWREGVQLMVLGEKRRLWIPGHLTQNDPTKGPTGPMIFDVELVNIKPIGDTLAFQAEPPDDAERTPAGARTKRVSPGQGDVKPGPASKVLVNYTGWTTDGKVFDSTSQRGRPTAFPLADVMAPFAEAVQLMVIGEKRMIWIPGQLAAGQWPGSPRGSLVFEVELLQLLPDDAFERAQPAEDSD